jgi:hypothetical protein
MTLDENPPRREHQALIDHYGPFPPQDPEFVRIANAQSVEERAIAAEERRVRDQVESIEARVAYWDGVFSRRPGWDRDAHWSGT